MGKKSKGTDRIHDIQCWKLTKTFQPFCSIIPMVYKSVNCWQSETSGRFSFLQWRSWCIGKCHLQNYCTADGWEQAYFPFIWNLRYKHCVVVISAWKISNLSELLSWKWQIFISLYLETFRIENDLCIGTHYVNTIVYFSEHWRLQMKSGSKREFFLVIVKLEIIIPQSFFSNSSP